MGQFAYFFGSKEVLVLRSHILQLFCKSRHIIRETVRVSGCQEAGTVAFGDKAVGVILLRHIAPHIHSAEVVAQHQLQLDAEVFRDKRGIVNNQSLHIFRFNSGRNAKQIPIFLICQQRTVLPGKNGTG